MRDLLIVVNNLFFQIRIRDMASRFGLPTRVATTPAELIEQAQRQVPALIVIDLTIHPGIIEAIRQLKQEGCPAPIVGYLPHTLVELAQQAQAAGCDRVLAQGVFAQQLATLIAEAKRTTQAV